MIQTLEAKSSLESSPFLSEPNPEAAALEDFRPGAVVQRIITSKNGQHEEPEITIMGYPYTKDREGCVGAWVDCINTETLQTEPNIAILSLDTTSLEEQGIVPIPNEGYVKNRYFKLIKPAPVENKTLPRSLRKIFTKSFAELGEKEQVQASRYFLGQQATSFLERKSQGVKEELLKNSR